METINITASKSYKVIIDGDILERSGELIKTVKRGGKALIVSDDKVSALYGKTVKTSLEDAGFLVSEFVFKNGEESKNLAVFGEIINALAENGFSRSDFIVALGGGVTGDMAGFASAVYLRGIDFIQIPTTLLAMVDSSVGGKTAVDIKQGKNLVGSFHQPSLVLCDTSCLKTLPKAVYLQGVAEAVKCAVIRDETLLEKIEKNDVQSIITSCIKIKAKVVENDEFDNGERQLLNFGHTFGHAVEKLSNFTIPHGDAVAIGMVMACGFAEKVGLIKDAKVKIEKLLMNLGLPTKSPFSKAEIFDVFFMDKKRKGDSINLILPKKIGDAILYPITLNELKKIFVD